DSDDSYILGEFLQESNEPCYFHEFSAKADSFGFAYLCDAELAHCFPEHISADTGALLRRMTANRLIPLEQYMDFFKGRSFRRTLMVKAAQAAKVQRTLAPERMRDLHVNARITSAKTGENTWVFSATGQGGQLTTRSEDVHRCLQRLSDL